MKKLFHNFLHIIKIYPFPHYFSYYIGSSHNLIEIKIDEKMHNETGSCHNCGHWEKVSEFSEIPKHLQGNKNAWREHCDFI